MSERTLTAPEIDALLRVFRAGSERQPEEARVEPYDVHQPTRIPRQALEGLRVRYDQAARAATRDLRQLLARDGDVTLQAFEQVVFPAWRADLPDPCCAFLVECRPLDAPAVLVLDHAFAFNGVDRLLGGRGETECPPRDLTPAESGVISELLQPVLQALVSAWSPYAVLRPRVLKQVSVPAFLRELRLDEVVLAASFRVSGFLGGESVIRFALPLSEVEPHLKEGDADETPAPRPAEPQPGVAHNLLDVDLGLWVRLGGAEVHLRDLLDLEEGDVVMLDRSEGDPVELLVEEKPKYKGHLLRRGRRLVFRVAKDGARGAAGGEARSGGRAEGATEKPEQNR